MIMRKTDRPRRPCFMCKGDPHPDTPHGQASPVVTIDGEVFTLTRCPRMGAWWTFQNPDGSISRVSPTARGLEALECAVRHELFSPSPPRDADDAWREVEGLGQGIHQDAIHPAAIIRYARVRAAIRRTYGAADDMAARSAQQRDHGHMYATPDDKYGHNHHARRYLAAYAAVLAEADPTEPVYPVERLSAAYADAAAPFTAQATCDDKWHGCGRTTPVPACPVHRGQVFGVGACACGQPVTVICAAAEATPRAAYESPWSTV